MYSILTVILNGVLAHGNDRKVVLVNSSCDDSLPYDICKSHGLKMVEATSENLNMLISTLREFGVESASVSGWNGAMENLVLRENGSALAPYDKYTNNATHAFCHMTRNYITAITPTVTDNPSK